MEVVTKFKHFISYFDIKTGEAGPEGLFQDFFDWRMRRSPEFSTFIGLKDYNNVLETFTEDRFSEDLTSCQGGHKSFENNILV